MLGASQWTSVGDLGTTVVIHAVLTKGYCAPVPGSLLASTIEFVKKWNGGNGWFSATGPGHASLASAARDAIGEDKTKIPAKIPDRGLVRERLHGFLLPSTATRLEIVGKYVNRCFAFVGVRPTQSLTLQNSPISPAVPAPHQASPRAPVSARQPGRPRSTRRGGRCGLNHRVLRQFQSLPCADQYSIIPPAPRRSSPE